MKKKKTPAPKKESAAAKKESSAAKKESSAAETPAPGQQKKHRGLRIALRILCVLLALLLCLALVLFIIPLTETEKQKTVAGSDSWMAGLSGDLRLNEITLPGTHDSATQYVQLAFFSKCQALNIGQQLEAGYRFLDIRLGVDEGRLKLMHGFTSCKTGPMPWSDDLWLEDVLAQCYDFLAAHPTETVVFAVKQEHGDERAAEFAALLEAVIAQQPDRWFTGNQIPTLDEARGKLVLFRRYLDDSLPPDADCAGILMYWRKQKGSKDTSLHTEMTDNGSYRLWVQDRYEYGTDDKWNAFLNGLAEERIAPEDLVVHYLSTKGTLPYGHPYGHADTLNARLMDQPSDSLKGWIVVDFASAPLAEHIYRANTK